MNDDNPHDPLPELIHSLDQLLAHMTHLAKMTRGYYNSFLEEGFTAAEALKLASDYGIATSGLNRISQGS